MATIVRLLAIFFAVLFCTTTALEAQEEKSQQQKEDELRGAPAEPDDAGEVRAQIAAVEKLLPAYVDRAAAFYFLAAAKMHLGETREALDSLKQCMAVATIWQVICAHAASAPSSKSPEHAEVPAPPTPVCACAS